MILGPAPLPQPPRSGKVVFYALSADLGWGDHHPSLPLCPSGLESPSHILRADAPPHASSAATICVTLAEGHRCDRALEILLHPSGEGMGHTVGRL